MNTIMTIAPYWHHGTWVFDDQSAGLSKEPFVAGIPEMINDLVNEIPIPDAQLGFRMTFSSAPFPGHQRKLTRVREEMGGNWYREDGTDREGWLCPALFKYFDAAPEELYVKAEPMRQMAASHAIQ